MAAYASADAYAFLRDEQKAIDDARLQDIRDRNIAEQQERQRLTDALSSGHDKYINDLESASDKERRIRGQAIKAINDHGQSHGLFGESVLDTVEELDAYIKTRELGAGHLSDARQQELLDAYNLIDAVTNLSDINERRTDREKQAAEERFNDIEAEAVRLEDLAEERRKEDEAALARAQALTDITSSLGDLGILAGDDADGILALSDSLSGLQTSVKNYRDFAFSDSENLLVDQGQAAQRLQDIAKSLGKTVDDIDTAEEFRAAIDENNDGTDQGRENVITLLSGIKDAALLDSADISGLEAIANVPDNLKDVVGGLIDLDTELADNLVILDTTTEQFTSTGVVVVDTLNNIGDQLNNIVNIPFPDFINRSNGVAGESSDKIATTLEKQIKESNARLNELKAEMSKVSDSNVDLKNVISIQNHRVNRLESDKQQYETELKTLAIRQTSALEDLAAKP